MTTTIEAGTLHHVAPGALLLERNIRDCQPTKELIDSVRDLGVLEPITAVSNPDGGLVVRFGHRRTLAAVEAGLDTVPVYVSGADWTDDDAEVDRIIRQRDENTHRSGLTAAEEVGVVEQLAAFGLTASQIATKARIARPAVDAAVTVAGSELTRKAAERYESLTLDQAAAVAEFEDDPETFKAMVVCAIESPGQFTHQLQRRRDDRARDRLIAEARERLTAEGVTVLDQAPSWDQKPKALHYLVDAATGEQVTEENHAGCRGSACAIRIEKAFVDADGVVHDENAVDRLFEAAYAVALEQARQEFTAAGHDPDDVDEDDVHDSVDLGLTETKHGVPYWYCTDPAKHGHRDRYASSNGGSTAKPAAADMTDEEREAARKARTLVIENNKAWDSAQTVRRDWLREFAKRKAAPKGAAAFTATVLASDRQVLTDYRVTAVVADLFNGNRPVHVEPHVMKLLNGASETRAQLVALVQILGSLEATLTQQSWRGNGTNSTAGRYLRFLEACGYELSDVEKFAISGKTV